MATVKITELCKEVITQIKTDFKFTFFMLIVF